VRRVRALLRLDALGPPVVFGRLRQPHAGGQAPRPPPGARVTFPP
jgi:hypothetical protein